MNKQIKIKKTFLCFLIPFFFSSLGQAFQDKSFGLGLGYFSQNILNKTAQSPSGSTKFLGETSYPFLFSYDFAISSTWFLTPRLGYTLLPRSTPGNRAKISFIHLEFLFGQNFTDSKWDWFLGPGYFQQTIKGAGGTTTLSNGTGTAVFAVPGRESSTKKNNI